MSDAGPAPAPRADVLEPPAVRHARRARGAGGPRSRIALLGLLLVVLGALFWVLHSLQSRTEHFSYAHRGPAPGTVTLSAGHVYSLAVPGGVSREVSYGADPGTLRCTATPVGGEQEQVGLRAEQLGSKATNQIATFVAPGSGRYAMHCRSVPASALYVDDEDGSGPDLSLLWLVLACAAFVVGAPLLLSGLRRPADYA